MTINRLTIPQIANKIAYLASRPDDLAPELADPPESDAPEALWKAIGTEIIEGSKSFQPTQNWAPLSIIINGFSANKLPAADILDLSKKIETMRSKEVITDFDDALRRTVWSLPHGEVILDTREVIGGGCEKTVTLAFDLLTGTPFARVGCSIQEGWTQYRLRGARGIAQVKHMIQPGRESSYLMFQELYYCNLMQVREPGKYLKKGAKNMRLNKKGSMQEYIPKFRKITLTKEDVKAIIPDLLCGLKALEGKSIEDWVGLCDLADRNICLKMDFATQRVVGASLIDFGEIRTSESYDYSDSSMQNQRGNFLDRYIQPLTRLVSVKFGKVTAEELCAHDAEAHEFYLRLKQDQSLSL